jgi:cell division protein FtsB
MSEKVNVVDIVVAWFIFWVLTILGLTLIGGAVLVPLWQEQYRLVGEYRIVKAQIAEIEEEVDRNRAQLEAICDDPLYMERIARSELNLRKVGEETLRIRPLRAPTDISEADPLALPLPKDFSNYWWYKLFLDDSRRRWYIILASCLLATAIITAIATKDRRREELETGFGL